MASKEALIAAIDHYLGQHVVQWPEPFPMQRGIAFVTAGQPPKVRTGQNPSALKKKSSLAYTKRIRYWSKQRNIDDSLRRIAMSDPRASNVADLALAAHRAA